MNKLPTRLPAAMKRALQVTQKASAGNINPLGVHCTQRKHTFLTPLSVRVFVCVRACVRLMLCHTMSICAAK